MKKQLDMLMCVQVYKTKELNYYSQSQVFVISRLWTHKKAYESKEKLLWHQAISEKMSTIKSALW